METHLNVTYSTPRKVAFHDFELDLGSGDLSRAGEPVRLAAQPAKALVLLVERAGDLVLRSEIQEHVWGDLVVEQEQGLNTCVRQIRSALGDQPSTPRFIETVPRRGYRFIAPVAATERHRPALSSQGKEPGGEGSGLAEVLTSDLSRGGTREPERRLGDGFFMLTGAALAVLALIAIAQRPWPLLNGPSAEAMAPEPSTELSSRPLSGTPPSVDPEAWEAYLRGRFLLDPGRRRDPAQAKIELKRALEIEPGLALAHVALADAYHTGHEPNSIERQRAALKTALELDPDLAPAYLRLAKIELHADWSFESAGRSFARAFELAPNDAEVLRNYAIYFSHLRRHDEAIEKIERARQLDPISVAVHGNGAGIYFSARRYEQAVEVSLRALELAPDHYEARTYLLHAYRKLGRHQLARVQALELMPRLGATAVEVAKVEEAADTESALLAFFEWHLEWLRARRASPVAMAAAVLPLGREDAVFEWLEKAYAQHSGDLLVIAGDPRADAFRGDPRFVDLLRRIGFPQETIER